MQGSVLKPDTLPKAISMALIEPKEKQKFTKLVYH